MIFKSSFFKTFLVFSFCIKTYGIDLSEQETFVPIDAGVGSSSNPSPVDHIGTGYLFEKLGLKKEKTGLSVEGLWVCDGDQLLSGGKPHKKKEPLII
ncbi:MAG: hypothetical protein V4489_05315 [Chlamydiota bacterium]